MGGADLRAQQRQLRIVERMREVAHGAELGFETGAGDRGERRGRGVGEGGEVGVAEVGARGRGGDEVARRVARSYDGDGAGG